MKIVIADDHHVVRKGLRFFFATQDDIEVVGEAATGIEGSPCHRRDKAGSCANGSVYARDGRHSSH